MPIIKGGPISVCGYMAYIERKEVENGHDVVITVSFISGSGEHVLNEIIEAKGLELLAKAEQK